MKVTALTRTRPSVTLAGYLSGNIGGSGQVPVSDGSNGVAWGSNVGNIWSNGSNHLLGPDVNFQAGVGIALSASSNTLTITNTGVPGPPGSGGSSSDPTIPTGGTLYDGTSTSGWTSFGSPDTFDANSTVAGHFYLQKTSMGTNNLVGVYRATSSFPRTYTMKISDGFFHASFHSIVLLVGEAAPGKYWTWGATRDGDAKYNQRYAWTTASSSGTNTNYPGSTGTHTGFWPAWYRIVVNSSTDIELWQSFNGYIYYRFASAQNPAFTIGVFGFGMATFAAIEHKIAIDWIHES